MNNPTPGQDAPKGSIGLGGEFVQGPPSHQEGAPRHRAEQDRTRTLKFFGSGRTLFGMWIVNVLLTLVTLGVYYFWAKVKVRSYLLSQTEFEGDRFAYHGTGNELLVGGLRVVILFGVPFLILSYGPGLVGAGGVTLGVSSLLASFIILAVPAFATVWALRYRLGRTSWRGIRFSFRGRVRDYVTLFVKGILLTTITIGLYYPFYAAQKRAFMVSHSYFGNERFEFDGRGDELFKVYFQAFLFISGLLKSGWNVTRQVTQSSGSEILIESLHINHPPCARLAESHLKRKRPYREYEPRPWWRADHLPERNKIIARRAEPVQQNDDGAVTPSAAVRAPGNANQQSAESLFTHEEHPPVSSMVKPGIRSGAARSCLHAHPNRSCS